MAASLRAGIQRGAGTLVLAGVVCLNGEGAAQSLIPSPSIPSPSIPSPLTPTTPSTPTPAPATPIADTADRIARNLWSPRVDQAAQGSLPVFRTGVTVDVRALPVPWHVKEKPGPSNPRFNGYHQEHLMLTTPAAFRTSTFYPIGMSIDPATVVNAAKKVWRDRQTTKIRKRIAEEIAELERATRAGTGTGTQSSATQP